MKLVRKLLALVCVVVLASCGGVYHVDPIIKADTAMATTWWECTGMFPCCSDDDKAEYINPYTYNPSLKGPEGLLPQGQQSLYQIVPVRKPHFSELRHAKKMTSRQNQLAASNLLSKTFVLSQF